MMTLTKKSTCDKLVEAMNQLYTVTKDCDQNLLSNVVQQLIVVRDEVISHENQIAILNARIDSAIKDLVVTQWARNGKNNFSDGTVTSIIRDLHHKFGYNGAFKRIIEIKNGNGIVLTLEEKEFLKSKAYLQLLDKIIAEREQQ